MNKIAVVSAIAGALGAVALNMAGSAGAAPSGRSSAADVATELRAQGFNVVVNHFGSASLNACTMYTLRQGQTYTRMDTGFPGAGDDAITRLLAMTVYLDTHC